jgi:hypothetical protein
LFSFQNIAANNGWAMALAGALIVMTGLTVLSFIISQLHRLVALLEKKESAAAVTVAPDPGGAPEKFPESLEAQAVLYEPLIQQLPETFGLNDLYALTRKNDFPHPHLTIRAFREAGLLVSQGEGQFSWNATK